MVFGFIALVISCLSMLQGWVSDNSTRKRLEDFGKATDRQADQIDSLIELNQSSLGQTNKWLELLNRIGLGGDA